LQHLQHSRKSRTEGLFAARRISRQDRRGQGDWSARLRGPAGRRSDFRARAVGQPVCGSARYRKLPQLLAELEAGNRRVTGLDTDTDETFETEMTRRDNPWRAYLTIIEGCDKACSYCVVPYTR